MECNGMECNGMECNGMEWNDYSLLCNVIIILYNFVNTLKHRPKTFSNFIPYYCWNLFFVFGMAHARME